MELERELIVRAQRGESEAQETLVSRLAPMVFRLASRFFRSREDVEDLAQEAFARFFLKIDQVRPDENVVGWMSRVTVNVCYDRLRKIQRERTAMEGFTAEPRPDNRPEFDAHEDVRTAVEGLDAKLRIPLLLKEVEELSVKEISEIMSLSQSNIKIRLYRARKKLAGVLRHRIEPAVQAEGEGSRSS
jgi:RNA polymerase sigma-70 factor (ECF subfamily)